MKNYVLPMVMLFVSNTSLTYADPLREESESLFRKLVISRHIPPVKTVSKKEDFSVTAEEREEFRTWKTKRKALYKEYRTVTPGVESMGEEEYINKLNALEKTYDDVIQKNNKHPGIFKKEIEVKNTTTSSSVSEVKKESFDYLEIRQRLKIDMDEGNIPDEIYDRDLLKLNEKLEEILGEEATLYLKERERLENDLKGDEIDDELRQYKNKELNELNTRLTKSLKEKSLSSKTEEDPEEKSEKGEIPTGTKNEKPEPLSEKERAISTTEIEAACVTLTNAILMRDLENTDFKNPNAQYKVWNPNFKKLELLGKPSFCLNVKGKRRRADPETGSFTGYTVRNFSVKESEFNGLFYGDYDKNPKTYEIKNIFADMRRGKDSCTVESKFCGVDVKFDLEFSFNILDLVTNDLKFKNAYGKKIEVSL